MLHALTGNFLGAAPSWYKKTILFFLILNPVSLLLFGPFVTGWLLIAQFIFTLAMALKCYPLQPGGLLAIEALLIGLTDTESVKQEVFHNFPVILLLMFMVAGIYFMQGLLLLVFTKILLKVRSKTNLSLLFCATAAVLSAFLDALTVTAVIISVCVGFYSVYHKVASGGSFLQAAHDHTHDALIQSDHEQDLDDFRAFLRSLLMHSAIGTALGGVCTTVGEPQNLLIAGVLDWDFAEFFIRMSPVTIPVLAAGLVTCAILEKSQLLGYGRRIPKRVLYILEEFDADQSAKRSDAERAKLVIQALCAAFLVFALAFHIAEVGLIGLTVIVLQTAFNGVIDERQVGHAFEEALPFTALLIVFFSIVAVIHEQHLFAGIINAVLSLPVSEQPPMFFIANGVLSMISDNVFVATVYISEIQMQFENGHISREHFETLAIAVNTGTNLPSVATPNGQAAFLFLLTSAIAPLIRLSYGRMVIMALPYTLVLGSVGLLCVSFNL